MAAIHSIRYTNINKVQLVQVLLIFCALLHFSLAINVDTIDLPEVICDLFDILPREPCKNGFYYKKSDSPLCQDRRICYRGVNERCDENDEMRCDKDLSCMCNRCQNCAGNNCSVVLCPMKQNWIKNFEKVLLEYNPRLIN